MKQDSQLQGDLFPSREPMENSIPASARAMVVRLLGELLWTVLEPESEARTAEDARDE